MSTAALRLPALRSRFPVWSLTMSMHCHHVALPTDERITHWQTDPTLCRGLAFLEAHAPMLLGHRKIPRA